MVCGGLQGPPLSAPPQPAFPAPSMAGLTAFTDHVLTACASAIGRAIRYTPMRFQLDESRGQRDLIAFVWTEPAPFWSGSMSPTATTFSVSLAKTRLR